MPECPRDDQGIQSLAGVAKPAGVTVYDDGIGLPCVGGLCPLPMLLGGSFRPFLLGDPGWNIRKSSGTVRAFSYGP